MKQLLRYASRSLLDSFVASSKTPRYSRAIIVRAQASTCPKCHFLITQRRQYSQNENKPTEPKPVESNSNSNGSLKPSQSESASSAPPKDQPVRNEDPSLPSQEESRRSRASKQANQLMDELQTKLFHASQRINDLTGYASIEHLKLSIEDLESQALVAQEHVRKARAAYKQMVTERAATQREHSSLLARKDTWSTADVQRFTELYKSDHEMERKVQEAAQELTDRERDAERVGVELQRNILRRYHEEQIWSDKIRRMSTWGTWGLMGVNVVLFLVVQFGFEPWRRRRLTKGFEEKVYEALTLEKNRNFENDLRLDVEGIETSKANKTDSETVNLAEASEEVSAEMAAALDAATAATMSEVEDIEQTVTGDLGSSDGQVPEQPNEAERLLEPTDSISEHQPPETLKARASGLLDKIEPSSILTPLRNPRDWRVTLWTRDLFSGRAVTLRKQDLTIIALEGAAAGAAVVGIIATIIFRRI